MFYVLKTSIIIDTFLFAALHNHCCVQAKKFIWVNSPHEDI